jgi:streptogramin lyase
MNRSSLVYARSRVRRARGDHVAPLVMALAVLLSSLATAYRATAVRASGHIAPSAQADASSRVPSGYPIVLASGAEGGVWYGGNRSDGTEPVGQVGYITPTGAFRQFPFGPELANHWPDYFAPARDGGEWFLADAKGVNLPLLGEVSPLGTVTVEHLPLDPSTDVRGLALGADGNLWTTATRIRGLTRESAILRVTPRGAVTAFGRGLQIGAIPENITAGRSRALWFTDAVGRIGRIDTTGRIREFPVGRQIVASTQRYAPTAPIVPARDGTLWFIVGPRMLGQMTTAGRIRVFTPRSSYSPPQDAGERGNLVGLAAAPQGGVWFTRESGEVARIDAQGHVTTLTNHLLKAYGIAFGKGGVAWIGEGPRYLPEGEEDETPARIARLAAVTARLHQYPPRPKCQAPALVGLDRAFAENAVLGDMTAGCEERVLLGRVRFTRTNHPGSYLVVSQTPRAGASTEGYIRVALKLERESPIPPPRVCTTPPFFQRVVRSPHLIVWTSTTGDYTESTETYYGCVPPHGTTRKIISTEQQTTDSSSLNALAYAGHLFGFVLSSGGKGGGGESLEIYDVSTGQRFLSLTTEAFAPYGEGPEPIELQGLGSPVGRGVQTFVLDARGDIAWVGRTEHSSTEPQMLVLYLHDQGGTRKLAVAHEIRKLAFHGSLLTWEAEGSPRSTPG